MYIIVCINNKIMYIDLILGIFSLEDEMQISSKSGAQPVKNIRKTFITLAQYFGIDYQ